MSNKMDIERFIRQHPLQAATIAVAGFSAITILDSFLRKQTVTAAYDPTAYDPTAYDPTAYDEGIIPRSANLLLVEYRRLNPLSRHLVETLAEEL
jgi:hypothetical protein